MLLPWFALTLLALLLLALLLELLSMLPVFSVLVILLAFLRVAQNLVGLVYQLKFFLCFLVVGIHIRMKFPGKLAIRFFNVVSSSILIDFQGLVIINKLHEANF